MDECLSVRTIGIGYILRRVLCKVLLIVVGKEATRVYETDRLCSELEVGIEGGIHHIRLLWDAYEDDEGLSILLIDAMNAFNEGNRKMIFWVTRHEWPSGSRFLFNIYRHHTVLVMRGKSKKKTFFLA